MGKRKRTKDCEKILKKIRKLESKLQKKRRRNSSNTDSESESYSRNYEELDTSDKNQPNEEIVTENIPNTDGDNITDQTNGNDIEVEDIDPSVLQMLGEDPSTLNILGDNINKHVAPRWQHILLNGLTKEVKTELLKIYLIPANCSNLKAPKLNPEMKAAINETNLKRDLFSETKQNQLSSCLAALGKVLDVALSSNLNQDLIKPLSDAGRLLCDYHHRESQSRRYAILNSLNKETRDAVKETKIDEYLFGSELAEHLKSAKAISKSGSEMRAAPAGVRAQFKPRVPMAPQRGSLNSRGASRTAATETRPPPYPTTARRPAPPAPTYQQRERGRRREAAVGLAQVTIEKTFESRSKFFV